MEVSATVRVKPDVSGTKPKRRKLERVADVLQSAGFHVLRIGRFGVSIKGEATDFSTILGVETSPNTALSAAVHPTQPELNELIDLVEVAPKPSMY